ncbi:MAG: hypothetical protein JSR72_15055 [Proteobacteria bacterium]|nr:hypothetical protein [Pseudomonadota bacterium]
MPATDTEQLIVQLEARINDFEKAFQRANKTANDNWSSIEARGRRASGRIRQDMGDAASSVSKLLQTLAGPFGGPAGILGGVGAGALLATAVKINAELVKMAGLAKRVQLDTDTFQGIKFAANSGGVSDEAFSSGIEGFAALLNDAKRNENDLGRLFKANNVELVDRQGKVLSVNQALAKTADLIRSAATEQDKIKIAEMSGLSRDWVRALEGGAPAFNKLADEARDAGAVVDARIIQKAQDFDREWTRASTKWSAQFKASAAEIIPLLEKLAEKAIEIIEGLGNKAGQAVIADKLTSNIELSAKELSQAISLAKSKGSPVDPSWEKELQRLNEALRERNRLQAFKTIGAAASPAPTGPATVIPKSPSDGQEKNSFDRALDQSRKRIALVDADTAAVGLNEEAHQRLRTVAELEEAAQRANAEAGRQNTAVTDEQRQKINQLADAMQAASQRQRQAQESWKGFNDVLQFSGGLAVDFFDKLGDSSAKLSDVVASALQMIKRAALQAALLGQGPLAGIFGVASGASGGTGGLLGAVGGLLTGKADGGYISGPGGPRSDSIPARLSNGEFVINATATAKHRGLLEAINRGVPVARFAAGGPVGPHSIAEKALGAVTQNISVTVNGSAGTPQQNQDLAEKITGQLQGVAESLVAKEINRQMRPGGLISSGRRR